MRRLVLFDIDGTILSAGGAGARAVRDALLAVFGTVGEIAGYSMGGRTDPQIAVELMTAAGLARDEVERRLPELWEVYVANLHRELAAVRLTPFPGVVELLERIEAHGDETVAGLLTGNVREGARAKLAAADLAWERFRVGAFGSDHADRPALPAVAQRRAREALGIRYEGKEIVIVGDTPFDIRCGEALGVRTIAVATGGHPEDELATHAPDHLFPSLADVDAVWDAIAR
jgi:phosphoglycolate phosphatase-like HAD superfamily hydrolase